MSGMFQELEGETAILAVGGVYKECPVYIRNNGELFAKAFGGFVRLKYDGATSKSAARLDTLTIADLYRDRLGNLTVNMAEGRKALEKTPHYVPLLEASTDG